MREEYKPIRESFEVLRSNREQFSPVVGDQLPDGSIFSVADATEDVKMPALTSKYIATIATFGELDFEIPPVLQVVGSKMSLEASSVIKKKNSIHFTHPSYVTEAMTLSQLDCPCIYRTKAINLTTAISSD